MPAAEIRSTTLRGLVVRHPKARAVLDAYGLDYCCGGAQRLDTAAAERGADLQALMRDLQAALDSSEDDAAPGQDWSRASLTALTRHILDAHHVYLKAALPRIEALLGKVRQAHGDRHGPMLASVDRVFSELAAEITGHLMKEEQVLFPYILALDAHKEGEGERPAIHCGSVEAPIRQMEHEHENAGAALAALRSITSGYLLPGDACPTFAALYQDLQALESDLHEHIHLENNILFPRAAEAARG